MWIVFLGIPINCQRLLSSLKSRRDIFMNLKKTRSICANVKTFLLYVTKPDDNETFLKRNYFC